MTPGAQASFDVVSHAVGHAQHRAQIRTPRRQPTNGVAERRHEAIDLTGPAARQDQEDAVVRFRPYRTAELRRMGGGTEIAVQSRIADECGR